MKKAVSIVLTIATISVSLLYSQTINIVQGWQNVGALTDINVSKSFYNVCIDIVWKYDSFTKSWSAYSPNNYIQNIINDRSDVSSLVVITKGNGFWIKANSKCVININNIVSSNDGNANSSNSDNNQTNILNISYNPIHQEPSYPGKYPGMYPNYAAFAALKEDGSVIVWGDVRHGGKMVLSDYNGNIISKIDEIKSGAKAIYSTEYAFAALKEDGSVVTWGDMYYGGKEAIVDFKNNININVSNKLKSDVKAIYSTRESFAALKEDGSVVTWGYAYSGGNSSDVANELKNGVKAIYSTESAFAALKEDGSVVTWGNEGKGGIEAIADLLNNKYIDISYNLKSGVKAIYSTDFAFAALKEDGSVVTWGDNENGGDTIIVDAGGSIIKDVSDKLKSGVKTIYSTNRAFAALKEDGSVITWGSNSMGGNTVVINNGNIIKDVSDKLKNGVKAIYSTESAFAALKEDGSVVTWGDIVGGGGMAVVDISGNIIKDVSDKLKSGVKTIYSNAGSFAALKEDGSVITWGSIYSGGDKAVCDMDENIIKDVAEQLKSGVKTIYRSSNAFAALKEDGSVVTWGNTYSGGDSSSVANKLKSGVIAIYSNANAFVALKEDGSIVGWGNRDFGGYSVNVENESNNSIVTISKSY